MPVPAVISSLSTAAASNSPASGESTITVDDYLRAHASFIAQLRDGIGFTAVRVNGATQGQVGAREGTGSGLTANSSFNNVVVDSSGNGGMSVLCATGIGGYVIGSAASPVSGALRYDVTAEQMSLWTGAVARITIDSTGMMSDVPFRHGGATQGNIGTMTGAGSGGTANSSYRQAVIDSDTNGGMTILTGLGSSGAVMFGTSAASANGRVQYNHADSELQLWAGGLPRAALIGGVAAIGTLGHLLGTGGSATQTPAKTDNVTINARAGMITMANTSLAAGASVEFNFVNNTLNSLSSMLLLNVLGSGGAMSYTVSSQPTNGSARIRLTNITAGALAEVVTLRFIVLDAPAA